MARRLESTSGVQMGSGFLPLQEGSQPPAPLRLGRHQGLPDRYNVPLLELLVVDPQFIFISWEITEGQLAEARTRFGSDYDSRRLQVVIRHPEDASVLAERELYGEIGRWFIQLDHPGVWILAELRFVTSGAVLPLLTAGPVFVPRDTPVEPEHWEELFVRYMRGEKGVLRIEALQPEEAPNWPRIGLPGRANGLPATTADTGSQVVTSLRRQHVDARLLRPLLPVAPAAVEEVEVD